MGPLVSEVQNPKTPNSAPQNSFGEALSETLSSLFIGNWQGQKQKVLGMIKQERLIWLLWRLSLWKGICNVSCWMQGSDLQQAEADGAKNHALPLQLSTELQQGQYAVVEAVYMGVHIDMDVLDRLWSEKWKVLQGSIPKKQKDRAPLPCRTLTSHEETHQERNRQRVEPAAGCLLEATTCHRLFCPTCLDLGLWSWGWIFKAKWILSS